MKKINGTAQWTILSDTLAIQEKVYGHIGHDMSRKEYIIRLMEGVPETAVAGSLITVSLRNVNIPGMIARWR